MWQIVITILILQTLFQVQEFDTPEALMTREGTLFREMMQAMGVTTVEQMKALT